MKIIIDKLTDRELLVEAVYHVFKINSKASLAKWYDSEHSPIRTQMFALFCYDVPYSVCMQMRTHDKNGALFIIESGRPDTGTAKEHSRNSPRNMFIMCNAQHLIDWSHKRLCMKTEGPTREFMLMLKSELADIDYDISCNMMPKCAYRGGVCNEFKPCK